MLGMLGAGFRARGTTLARRSLGRSVARVPYSRASQVQADESCSPKTKRAFGEDLGQVPTKWIANVALDQLQPVTVPDASAVSVLLSELRLSVAEL